MDMKNFALCLDMKTTPGWRSFNVAYKLLYLSFCFRYKGQHRFVKNIWIPFNASLWILQFSVVG